MIVPAKITFSGDEFAGKRFIKQAHVQIDLLKADMRYLGLAQGRRMVTLFPGVTVEARVCFNLESVNIDVVPAIGAELRKAQEIEKVLAWYWYALCVSLYPPDPETGIQLPINGGESLSAIAIDGMRNVWVAGYSNTKRDFAEPADELSNEAILIKYDFDGKFKGRRVLVGGAALGTNANEAGTGVSIDRTSDPLLPLRGGIYLAADTYQDRFGANYDTSIVKYGHDGLIKWQRRLTFPADENTMLLNWGAASDLAGNVYVWGVINFFDNEDPFDFLYYEGYVASFAYDGALRWKIQLGDDLRDLNGDPTTTNYAFIKAVAPDRLGNIYTCGTLMDQFIGAIRPVGVVAKLDEDGVLVWKRAIQGLFRQANELYGWYGTGVDIEGCATDADGNVYTVSKSQIILGTNTGYFHYHVTMITAAGEMGWQRFIETQYYSDSSAALSRVRIEVGDGAVYITVPRHPNPGAVPAQPWGILIFKFHQHDSVDPAGFKAGDVIWQRLLTLDLPQPEFTNYSGAMAYSIKTSSGDLFIAGTVLDDTSALTIKLPGSGAFLGNKRGLVFTDTALPLYPEGPPAVPVYSDPEDIPVRQDPGEGEGDPGYEFSLVSNFALPILPGPMSVINPTDGDYVSPVWTQTNKILNKINIFVREDS